MAEQMDMTGEDIPTNHEYDGIQEFDNPMPRWWLLTFYGAIVFAFAYYFYFQSTGIGMSAVENYEAEMLAAEAESMAREEAMLAEHGGKFDDATLVAWSEDAEVVAKGKAVYDQNCLACHADKGQGMIGPNLTDDYWIHGGKPEQIFELISNGFLAKGMPAWKPALGVGKVRDVTAFVLTIRGSNIEGKAPEGVNAAGQGPQ